MWITSSWLKIRAFFAHPFFGKHSKFILTFQINACLSRYVLKSSWTNSKLHNLFLNVKCWCHLSHFLFSPTTNGIYPSYFFPFYSWKLLPCHLLARRWIKAYQLGHHQKSDTIYGVSSTIIWKYNIWFSYDPLFSVHD